MAKNAKNKKSQKKRAPKKTNKSSEPSKTFTQKVLKVVNKKTEKKHAYLQSGNSLIMFNSGIDSSADVYQILPGISKGTADNNRIGDELNGRSLRVKGFMKLSPKTQTGTVVNEPKISNVVCRLMILSMKSEASLGGVISEFGSKATALLRKGGTTTAFTGSLSDIFADVNTDVFTVHHNSVHYLTQDYVFVPSSTVAFTNSAVAIDTKDSVRFFNIDVKCKKTLKFDSSTDADIRPTNFAPFLVMGYSYLSGDTPDVVNTQVGLQYISEFIFDDC